MKRLFILLAVPLLLNSCTAGFVIGRSNRQLQEQNWRVDSTSVSPSLVIK